MGMEIYADLGKYKVSKRGLENEKYPTHLKIQSLNIRGLENEKYPTRLKDKVSIYANPTTKTTKTFLNTKLSQIYSLKYT